MVENTLVSIVIPVFNTPLIYLRDCLNSLNHQNYKTIEVLLIDDGSRKKFASDYDGMKREFPDLRLKIVHKKNGGVSDSRNYGIACARGKYICFVDSDDAVHADYVLCLLNAIRRNKTHVSACLHVRFRNKLPKVDESGNEYVFEKSDIWENMNTGYCFNKMYETEICRKILFQTGLNMCEDLIFSNKYLEKCPRCAFVERILYFYRDNPDSLSRHISSKEYIHAIDALNYIQEIDYVKARKTLFIDAVCFQGNIKFKYMLSLVRENFWGTDSLKTAREDFISNVLPVSQGRANDRYMNIARVIVPLPYPIMTAAMKLFCLLYNYWLFAKKIKPTQRIAEIMKKQPLLNTYVNNLDMQETVYAIERMIADGQKHYVVPVNVDVIIKMEKDLYLKKIIDNADMVLVDGKPLVWIAKWHKRPVKAKISGSDLIPVLCEKAAEKGYTILIIGGKDGIAERAKNKLEMQYSKINIAATYAPPFGFEKDQEELDKINRMIRNINPDLLIVCFGCPKQEKWIYENYKKYNAKVSICGGATVDFLAGNIKRAPKWMSEHGLEWFYRFIHEPRRMFKRYFIDDVKILKLIKKYK